MSSSNDTDIVTAALARNLKAARGKRGLTLDQLSAAAGISKGMLVQMEQGRTNPSLATLLRLSAALGLPLARLVEVAETPEVRIVRGAEAPVLWRGRQGGTGKLLGGTDAPDIVELWDWVVQPGERIESEPHEPGTMELVAVRSGRLALDLGGQETLVDAGDTAIFRADLPHAYAAADGAAVTLTMVVLARWQPQAGR
jgi:transcriptional regulator with XRE-family HTH domain